MRKEIPLESLQGETLVAIDADDEDGILLTTQSGRQIRIYHCHECCESVVIEGTDGQWHTLIGKPILLASHEEGQIGDAPERAESWTRTVLTLKVDDATVINRWIGESNGYYSETITIEELTEKK